MSMTSKPPEKPPSAYVFSMKFATVGAQVGCLTLIIVLASVFGGIWLDRILGTKPALTVLLVLGSAPISLFLTFWIAMRSIRDQNTQAGASPQATARKEDSDSE
jgi:F0F1-type ATP synthase assembly protein I